MSALFLTSEEVSELTGAKIKKRQVEWLRRSGLRFWVNLAGRPIVPRSAIDGLPPQPGERVREKWQPAVLMRDK